MAVKNPTPLKANDARTLVESLFKNPDFVEKFERAQQKHEKARQKVSAEIRTIGQVSERDLSIHMNNK